MPQNQLNDDYTKFTTIQEAIQAYLDSISLARSQKTADTYRYALQMFTALLKERNFDLASAEASALPEDAVGWFAAHLKVYSAATEQLYLQAVKGFYEYLAGENLASPNLPRVRLLIRQRSRRPGQRLPQFPRESIKEMLDYAQSLAKIDTGDDREKLRNLRDRAFLLVLADTGLRVHEACKLRRGDLDRFENKAIIIGKGNREAVVRFSERAMSAINDYLNARSSLDGGSGRPLPSLPLFARHDRGAGRKIKPITTRTGQNIIEQRVREKLGDRAAGAITPHSFRHYFVTIVLTATKNLKLAQELARHKNIAVTQRYAHLSDDELDKGYRDVFEKD